MIESSLQAVFVDRDGVLNRYVRADYVRTPDELHLLPGVAVAVRRLNERQIPIIVISNQQGVGKRLMTREALASVDLALKDKLRADGDAYLSGIYYCLHLATDGCECRKPKPGLVRQAAADHNLDISRCVMIGDSLSDIAVGNNAGVAQTILVMSGGTEFVELAALQQPARPTFVARDLITAVSHLLEAHPQ